MSLNPLGKDIPVSLGDLQNEMNHMFDRLWHGGLTTGPFDGNAWAPTFDVLDEDERVMIVAEVAGMEAADIELSFQGDRLTVKGHRPSPWPEEAAKKLLRRERRYGSFSRTIELPPGIDADKISATVRQGVLTVTLPKVEPARGKSIKIDSAE
ncbi:MAG: Hsp20/alpha crystallin family protein [Planctomycetota bacterium]